MTHLVCRKCGLPADPERDWWHLLRGGTVLMLTCIRCKPAKVAKPICCEANDTGDGHNTGCAMGALEQEASDNQARREP